MNSYNEFGEFLEAKWKDAKKTHQDEMDFIYNRSVESRDFLLRYSPEYYGRRLKEVTNMVDGLFDKRKSDGNQ